MKTYLLDTLNRYKRFSESLDVKTVLCNKAWKVFNDSGENEIYIFQEDGSLIVSYGGEVTPAKWQYISANKSLIISTKEQAYMLHPAFLHKNVFALQQDGTNRYAFMIDENKAKDFKPKSLTELNEYVDNIIRIEIARERQRLLEAQQREEEARREREEKERKARIRKEAKRIYEMRQGPIYKEARRRRRKDTRLPIYGTFISWGLVIIMIRSVSEIEEFFLLYMLLYILVFMSAICFTAYLLLICDESTIDIIEDILRSKEQE